jgi:7-cyano-7-deazaguanine tRNA-ribosyltransferase
MLYAKHDRYIMEDSTAHLSEVAYFSCNCEVCTRLKPKEMLSLDKEDRTNKIALHNLYAIKAEVDRVKEAIHEGRLWEYTIRKARAHPKLFETISTFINNTSFFIETTPRYKENAVFLFSKEDQFRPEIFRYHSIVRKFKTKKKTLVIIPDGGIRPFYASAEYNNLKKEFISELEDVQFCQYNPYLGIIPLELSDIYPAAHYVVSDTIFDQNGFPEFTKTWKTFLRQNKFKKIYATKDEFLKHHSKGLKIKIKFLNIKK